MRQVIRGVGWLGGGDAKMKECGDTNKIFVGKLNYLNLKNQIMKGKTPSCYIAIF